jgi:hypothetical protein
MVALLLLLVAAAVGHLLMVLVVCFGAAVGLRAQSATLSYVSWRVLLVKWASDGEW